MQTQASSKVVLLRRVGVASTVFAFALVAWGAVVRINNAGMTCPDWPRCRGVWFPALNDPVMFEWTHRAAAAALTAAIAATFAAAYYARAEAPAAYRTAWFPFGLIFAQIVAGWLTIKFANNPPSVAFHLVVGFATFASLFMVTLVAYQATKDGDPGAVGSGRSEVDRYSRASGSGAAVRFAWLALGCTVLALAAVFAAGWMAAANDGLACTGLPLCNGFGGALTPDQQIHMVHRYAAYATLVAVAGTWVAATRVAGPQRKKILATASVALGLAFLQGLLGVQTILTRLHPVFRSWHEANAALLVGALIALTYFAFGDLHRRPV